MGRKKRGGVLRLLVIGLTVGAVVQELRKPEKERTWHGEVAGFVPYDFRVPSLDKIRSRWWNPADERLFMPSVFGVGWTVNLGRVARLAGLA